MHMSNKCAPTNMVTKTHRTMYKVRDCNINSNCTRKNKVNKTQHTVYKAHPATFTRASYIVFCV